MENCLTEVIIICCLLVMKSDGKHYLTQLVVATIAGLIGVLVGTNLGQYYAVHNLSRSLKFQESREILNSTRLGIGFLMQVQNELDENAALLLNGNYDILLKTASPKGMFDNMVKMLTESPEAKTNAEMLATITNWLASFNLPVCHVDVFHVPSLNLCNDVWKHGAPELADIDYDLLRKLSDYYMLVGRVNTLIEAFNSSQVEPGGQISPEMAAKLGDMVFQYGDNIKKVRGKDVVELKDEVSKEIQRLSLIRNRLLDESQ